MRRSLLATSRRLQRTLSTQAATAAEVPNDPDVLTTQSPELNPTTSDGTPAHDSVAAVDSSRKYPRLNYRKPALGVNPAFDLALDLIKQDKASTIAKIRATKIKLVRQASKPDSALKNSKLRDLGLYIQHLEELVDINDPEIHWRHSRGDVDLSMPIYRRLAQRTWSEKALLLLMQRVTQMSVTPDVIPIISPTVDVRLSFPARTKGERKGKFEVGEILNSTESSVMPRVEIQPFYPSEKKYTIAIVDPDVPDQAKDSFQTYLHYLQKDISLTPSQHEVDSSNGTVVHTYVPPHPAQGTLNHRYTAIVWEQPDVAPNPGAPLAGSKEFPRSGFEAQTYAKQNGLHAVGISFWRQEWDAKVAKVMKKYPEVQYDDSTIYKRIKA